MATTNATLRKLIAGVLTDLMVRTKVDNVIYSDGVTLAEKLADILAKLGALGTMSARNEIAYTDLASALKTLIDGKANKGTTLMSYGINDAYTKEQVDGMIAGLWTFKGTKDYQSELPTTGNKNGDVWQVKYKGTSGTTAWDAEFAWNGTQWVLLGTTEAVDLSGYVPNTRKVNGKALSGDIMLSAGDVGAVPTSRKVNGKELSADITLSASDVGAGRVLTGTSATPPADLAENDLYIQIL